jgi:hypothetical protein
VSERHQKEHHAHETTDAFAEGWDSRARALPNEVVKNPYRAEIAALSKKSGKQITRQINSRLRDAVLWDTGFTAYEEDLKDPT